MVANVEKTMMYKDPPKVSKPVRVLKVSGSQGVDMKSIFNQKKALDKSIVTAVRNVSLILAVS